MELRNPSLLPGILRLRRGSYRLDTVPLRPQPVLGRLIPPPLRMELIGVRLEPVHLRLMVGMLGMEYFWA